MTGHKQDRDILTRRWHMIAVSTRRVIVVCRSGDLRPQEKSGAKGRITNKLNKYSRAAQLAFSDPNNKSQLTWYLARMHSMNICCF